MIPLFLIITKYCYQYHFFTFNYINNTSYLHPNLTCISSAHIHRRHLEELDFNQIFIVRLLFKCIPIMHGGLII
jgi:hypothetical protein